MAKQTPPGVTGTPKNTPKSIPGGPLKPAMLGKDFKPNNSSSKKGQQSRG